MKLLKLLSVLAVFACVLTWPTKTVKASECCIRDCYDTYFTMQDNGVPADQANQWLAECKSNCEQHGDPTTCPLISVNRLPNSLRLIDRHDEVSRALQELLRADPVTVVQTRGDSVKQGPTFSAP